MGIKDCFVPFYHWKGSCTYTIGSKQIVCSLEIVEYANHSIIFFSHNNSANSTISQANRLNQTVLLAKQTGWTASLSNSCLWAIHLLFVFPSRSLRQISGWSQAHQILTIVDAQTIFKRDQYWYKYWYMGSYWMAHISMF